MMVKAHVSPGLRPKTKPHIEHCSRWDHPENSRPSPQCGQRLRSPRQSAVLIKLEREGVLPCRMRAGSARQHELARAFHEHVGLSPSQSKSNGANLLGAGPASDPAT